MATISTENEGITFINVWKVEPANQNSLVHLLADMIESVMKQQEGFVSAKIHASLDGTQAIVYEQWRSQEDWERNFRNSETTSRLEKMIAIATPEPNLYKVVYVT